MSIRVMSQVWESARYEGGELLVLLALADWCNAENRCWPSVPAIAKKARLEERQVYRILTKMCDDQVITRESGGGRGKSSSYVINPDNLSGFRAPKTLSPTTENPVMEDTETLSPTTLNPVMEDKNGGAIYITVIEPSVEPSEEPPALAVDFSPAPPREAPPKNQPPKNQPSEQVYQAADTVCLAFSWIDRELHNAVANAIRIAIEHPDCDLKPHQIAETIKRRWGEYQEEMRYLRYVWSPLGFIRGGHWRPDDAWPYDQQLVQRAREASVGAHRP